MPKITQLTLQSIKVTGSVYYIRDSDIKGLAIKVTAKGQASFVVEGRIKRGGTFRITLGSIEHIGLKDAQAQALDIMASAKRGINPKYDRVSTTSGEQTLRWCLEQHLSLRLMADTTKQTYRNQINRAFKDWYTEPVEQLTPMRIAERRVKLLGQGLSVNYVSSCLRTLKAVLENSNLGKNPVTAASKKYGFSIQSSATEKEEFLYPDQIVEILNQYAMSTNFEEVYTRDNVYLGDKPVPNIFAAVLYLLLIGGREQDVYNLKWDMVDLNRNTITYPSRSKKERRPHVIPIIGILEDIIRTQPKHIRHRELVFGMTHEMFRVRYNSLVKGITKHSSKALRKTWAEHMGLDGYDDKSIGRGLNHSHALQGSVTTRSYFKGSLVKQNHLKEMYLDIQLRYIHYAMGNAYDVAVGDNVLDSLAGQNKEDPISIAIINKFPSLLAILEANTSEEAINEIRNYNVLVASSGI